MQNWRIQFSGTRFLIDSFRVLKTVHPNISNHQGVSRSSVVWRKIEGLSTLTDSFLKLPDKPVVGVKPEVRNVIPRIGSRPFHMSLAHLVHFAGHPIVVIPLNGEALALAHAFSQVESLLQVRRRLVVFV